MTIEERAKDLCYKIDQCYTFYTLSFCDDLQYDEDRALSCAKTILVEQDRIARAEERERCIKAAQIATCKCCMSYHVGCAEQDNCQKLDKICKAIEEGE